MTIEGNVITNSEPPVTENKTPASDAGVSDSGDKGKAASILAGGGEGDGGGKGAATPQAGEEGPSWRDKLAGDDATFRKQLDRYDSEASFGKAHRALLQKMSSGELKADLPFPEKGTDEEKAAWRKERGIYEKPEEYVGALKLSDGIVPGEGDKPGLERLAARAAKENWSADRYNSTVEAYYAEVDAARAAREELDAQEQQTGQDELRVDWGPDYRRNENAIHNMLNAAPKDVRDALMGARNAEGKLLGNDVAYMKWLAEIAIERGGESTILPSGVNSVSSIDTEIAAIQKTMREDGAAYFKNEPLQARYRDLLAAKEKQASRAA